MSTLLGKSLLIVDRHPIVRDALSIAVRSLVAVTRVVAVESLAEARLQVQHAHFDLLLVDCLPVGKRERLYLDAMRRHSPPLPVLQFAHDESAESLDSARSAGIEGFIPRSAALTALLSAIESLLQGSTHFPAAMPEPGLTARLPTACPVFLSERRREVLRLVMRGMTNGEIAAEIGIAEGTVKSHVSHVMRTFEVSNRAQLILRAQQSGQA